MTQPAPRPNPAQEAAINDLRQPTATDCLLHLLLTLLTPMFLLGTEGDIRLARMTALGAINAYQARDNADLISIAQAVAFGLAALGSLSLSMADDLSLTMVLRLRGNANACERSAERHRRALRQDRPILDPDASQPEAPPPSQPLPPAAAQPSAAMPNQTLWAAAMATVAQEYAAEIPNLPPQERKLAAIRVNALNYCIDELRSGNQRPPGSVP